MSDCPCGSKKSYQDCCEKLHSESSYALTPEELMRARYSAFVKSHIDFIEKTHIPGTQDFDYQEALEWSKSSQWKGLEIVQTQDIDQSTGLVEFKAYYADKNDKDYVHHERAQFKKIDKKWYFEQGFSPEILPFKREQPKIGRNDPCICQSGKKYKKCCGK